MLSPSISLSTISPFHCRNQAPGSCSGPLHTSVLMFRIPPLLPSPPLPKAFKASHPYKTTSKCCTRITICQIHRLGNFNQIISFNLQWEPPTGIYSPHFLQRVIRPTSPRPLRLQAQCSALPLPLATGSSSSPLLGAPLSEPYAHSSVPLYGPFCGPVHIKGGLGVSLPKNSPIIVK